MPIGQTNPHARSLRTTATDAERALWSHLRNRQLGGLKIRRPATVGPYIAEFLCAELSLIVEADGGQHTPEADHARTAFLEARGYTLLRFWNTDILSNLDGVPAVILKAAQQAKPSPNPLPPAGVGEEGQSKEFSPGADRDTQPSPASGRGQGEGLFP